MSEEWDAVTNYLIRELFRAMEEGMTGKINGPWDGRTWASKTLESAAAARLFRALESGDTTARGEL